MKIFGKQENSQSDETQALQNEVNRLAQAIRDYGKTIDGILDQGLQPFVTARNLRETAKMARDFKSELEK